MNFLGRAFTGELLFSSRSSSRKYLLLLLLQQQQCQQYPISLFPKHSSMYSTSAPSRLKKSQESYTVKKSKPHPTQQYPFPSTSFPETVQNTQNEEIELGLNKAPLTDWPRPIEIPFQAKVCNSVNLIGHVQIPVQFETSSDGKYWAGTILSQQDKHSSDSPPFWIPIIFEGDLAHIAACHLKAKDYVSVAGQLSADPPPFTMSHGQANVQVMVSSINFVQGYSKMKKAFTPHVLDKRDNNCAVRDIKDDGNPGFDSWRDLLRNPQKWQDLREKKLNGLLKPKYPDFKHKDSGLALWLNSAPKWVMSELGEEFDVQPPKVKQTKESKEFDVQPPKVKQTKESKGADSWKNLVENPDKWWDNRTTKVNKRGPDFKHKDTGEALWLSNSPAWVSPKLPPLKAPHTATISKGSKLFSKTIQREDAI